MTSRALVVGICGKARAGKDTLAEMISDYVTDVAPEAKLKVLISPMADPIKLMLGNFLFPFFDNKGSAVDDCLYGDAKDEPVEALGVTPRRMLQTLGTEWGRTVHPDIWIKAKRATIDAYSVHHGSLLDLVLIPDIRFDNEAEMLCDIVVYIDRPYNPDALKTVESAGHASERGISSHYLDISVSNDGTLEDLEATIPTVWDAIADVAYKLDQQQLGEEDDELNAQ